MSADQPKDVASQSLFGQPPTERRLPLTGVRVIDMSRNAPGPYCTMLLADLGAEVIVDGGGRAGPPVSSFARGKRFITLDLKAEEGRRAVGRLVETADVFVESFRPGVAERLGAGYDALSASNPGLVYCSLTGYGQSGPLAQEAGHDLNYLALSGILGAIGPDDRQLRRDDRHSGGAIRTDLVGQGTAHRRRHDRWLHVADDDALRGLEFEGHAVPWARPAGGQCTVLPVLPHERRPLRVGRRTRAPILCCAVGRSGRRAGAGPDGHGSVATDRADLREGLRRQAEGRVGGAIQGTRRLRVPGPGSGRGLGTRAHQGAFCRGLGAVDSTDSGLRPYATRHASHG